MVRIRIKTTVTKGKDLLIPEKWRKFANEVMDKYIKSTIKSIRYRMPVDTGFLRRSLKADKNKDKLTRYIMSDARYLAAVNKGVSPAFIPFEYMWQHMQSPGIKGVPVSNPTWHKGKNSVYTKTNFMERGLDAATKRFQNYVNEGMKVFKK